MDMEFEGKKAAKIGGLCVFSYLASYCIRNILSVITPSMLAGGEYTKAFIGLMSSSYFFVYAIGQLVNGFIGDNVNPKIMTFTGLSAAGIISVLVPFIKIRFLQITIYALMGFALSMLRGPLVKAISENTLPKYARICCVFFSFASFIGPFMASLLAMCFDWKATFVSAGIITLAIGVFSFVFFSYLERNQIIVYKKSQNTNMAKNILKIFKLENIFFYMIIGALVEISVTSIGFWIPTYMNERLGLSKNMSNFMFSIITFVKAATPFVALFVFKFFKENDVAMARCAFLWASIFFIALLIIKNTYINIAVFMLALMAVGNASTLLWSVYIPAQSKSGVVSALNGVLDFCGYACACGANIVFSLTMTNLGWNGVILIWIGLMVLGFISSFFVKAKNFNV